MSGPIRPIRVYSGSAPGARPTDLADARALGTLLAEREIGLVYGGASVGLMGAVADAAIRVGRAAAHGAHVGGAAPDVILHRRVLTGGQELPPSRGAVGRPPPQCARGPAGARRPAPGDRRGARPGDALNRAGACTLPGVGGDR